MQFPNSAGIYQILNLVNGKIYIGSAINLRQRRNEHFSRLRCNRHPNKHIQSSFNKYGEHNFDFEVLQLIQNPKSLSGCEQFWMDKTGCADKKFGYNSSPTAGNTLGVKLSKEAIQKSVTSRRINNKGKPRIFTTEHRANISKAVTGKNHPMYGRKHSQISRNKMSESHRGENNSRAKLNELQVKVIRSLSSDFKNQLITLKDMSNYFNISVGVASKIMKNKSWKYL